MEISENVKEEVELNRKALSASRVTKDYICSISGKARGIMFKLSENVEVSLKTMCILIVKVVYLKFLRNS